MESAQGYHLRTGLSKTKKNSASGYQDGEYFDTGQWGPEGICDI